jgi:Amt family ammonium transporter
MKRKLLFGLIGAAGALVLFATPTVAQDEDPLAIAEAVQGNLDNVFVLVCATLVIFMQAGFALVEAGMTRSKNVANIFMKNLMDFCVGGLAFFAVGFAFAYGAADGGISNFIGSEGWFLGDNAFTYGSLTVPTFFVFQVAFAATAATIVSGAMAERTKFISYVIYSLVISALIYPVVVHWVWGGGWLLQMDTPFHDFAGSTIVHSVGGWASLMGAMILGPRIGKYGADGKPRQMGGHSIAFGILGCFILLVGWYGFNPGSELAADGAIGGIALTTTLAACAGAVMAMTTTWLKNGKPDVGMTGNGLLAGLVGITAGAAALTGPWSILVGAIAGVIVVFAVEFFEKMKIDDPVGAISVHGVCGVWGTLAVGLFASQDVDGFWKQGLLLGGGPDQLISQVIGIVAVFFWTTITAGILFLALKHTIGLRVTPEEELEGLDIGEHGAYGYEEHIVLPSIEAHKADHGTPVSV